MQYYKKLYLGENVASRKEKILEKLKKKETVLNVYLIILPRYPKKHFLTLYYCIKNVFRETCR